MSPRYELEQRPVLLSASLPDELSGTPRAQALYDLVVVLVVDILSSNGRLIFGGHPTITPLVHHVVTATGPYPGRIELFQLERYRATAPEEVHDRQAFDAVTWLGDPTDATPEGLVADLTELREVMAARAEAAVFVGGRTQGFHGALPGIRDEYQRFLQRHPSGPVYLLGLLAGESARIIQELEAEGRREPNGLEDAQLRAMHWTHDVDLIDALVMRDLAK